MADDDEKRLTPDRVRRQNLMPSPESPLDISINMIIPQTGRSPLGADMEKDIQIGFYNHDNEYTEISGWDIFTLITSDTRWGNLTLNDKVYVEWALKCALLFRQAGLKKSTITALSLAVSVVEPGLGLNGFLRNNWQTIKQETQHVSIEETPKKRNILGMISKTS